MSFQRVSAGGEEGVALRFILMNNNKPYSRHIFIFPFQWDYIGRQVSQKGDLSYNERTDIDAFDRIFRQETKLKRSFFEIRDSHTRYNEFTYFYPFVRNTLYGTRENKSVYFYELEDEGGTYSIDIKADINRTYHLKLTKVSVHIFDTGVGLVAFSLLNDLYTQEHDILRINDFGRRLYPQFLDSEKRLKAKDVFLANSISGHIASLDFYEDFSRFEGEVDHRSPFLPPDHIRQVFGYSKTDRVGDEWRKFVFRDQDERRGTIRISPIMDDRMYFLSYYRNDSLADRVGMKQGMICRAIRNVLDRGAIDTGYLYEVGEESNFWYRYMYGDGNSKGIANSDFQISEIRKATYSRWVEYGTLIGITRDSATYLSTTRFDVLEAQFLSMYYQMAILSIVQRAGILRFSGEIANLTQNALGKKKRTSKNIKELYESYIKFLNQVVFREVTSQIQGIEMYDLFQKAMNIERDAKALDAEMSELFNYLEIEEQSNLNKTANLYLPLALLTGVLGINTLADGWFGSLLGWLGSDKGWHSWNIGDFITTIVIAVCLYFPIRYHIKTKNK